MNVNATQFKAMCLKLIDNVATTHQSLVITKRGKPIVRIVPIEDISIPSLFGYMKGTGQIIGDIVNFPSEAWSADTGVESPRRRVE